MTAADIKAQADRVIIELTRRLYVHLIDRNEYTEAVADVNKWAESEIQRLEQRE